MENFPRLLKTDHFKRDENIKIFEFFNNKHRAELLKNLPFSNPFVKEFLKKMKEFRDKNDINDGGQINAVQTLEELLNYVSSIKINFIKYYDLLTGIY